jgi:Putative  PD-(D/E)XK family member, (DUF4420)
MNEGGLIDAWRIFLKAPDPGLHLVDPRHVLPIFVGKTDQGTPRMVIRSSVKGARPSLSSVVLVERYEDEGGKWNLSFTLQDSKFTEVFLRLADDVHARTAQAPNEAAALDRVSQVIDEWHRLLKPRPAALLTMEELRGLVGEVWLLLSEFSATRPMDAAVAGWLGPMGLPQDFWYPESGFHEAKVVGPSTTRLRISSEAQLDASPLELLVVHVANTAEGTTGAVTLTTLAVRVTAALAELGISADPFTERLDQLGVSLCESYYADTWFLVTLLQSYAVTPEFPAIRASQLDPSVTRVTYQVQLSSIGNFLQRSVKVN